MPSQKIEFPGSSGALLAARLDLPDAPARAYALFAHCFTCSKDTKAATYITKALVEADIAVLRFDFTGLGSSEGDFSNTNFSSNIEDLVAAANWLRVHHAAPAILVGHSLGGAAVLAAAERIPEALALATVGAPFDPAHVAKQFGAAAGAIAQDGAAQVSLAGRAFTIRKQFLDDITSQSPAARIGKLKRALLVFHSPVDTTVDIRNAQEIYLAAKHPKSFVSLDQADHLLTRVEDGLYVGHVLAAWARRYLPMQAGLAHAAANVSAGVVAVAETGTGKFTNTVKTATHTIHAGEPPSAGGNGRGLSPLRSALGSARRLHLDDPAHVRRS